MRQRNDKVVNGQERILMIMNASFTIHYIIAVVFNTFYRMDLLCLNSDPQ
ncbi:MAG TPA: hypothetical protein VFP97_06120 [Chitinophagaceae bacterium]|nr:hypothetical protein [Chitinophagaceae bacterium]